MATVKFSGELRNSIMNNAEALFRGKIEAAAKDYDNNWGERIFALGHQPFMETINKLPRQWFNWTDEVNCRVIAGVRLDQNIKFKFSTPVPVPTADLHKAEVSPISIYKDAYYISTMEVDDVPMFADIKTEVIAYKNKITLLTERKDKFVSGVRELIYAHSSLAPALKAWQPLWDLLPDETKVRHNTKVERNAKVDIQLAADLNALTATIVASKIGA
jgi:hypothetical protein